MELNARSESLATALQIDVCLWESQLSTFKSAVDHAGRIDYVFPIAGIGEKQFLLNNPNAEDFVKPNLEVLDADLNGVLYTVSLAIQQFRRQDKDANGFRGKSESKKPKIVFPTSPLHSKTQNTELSEQSAASHPFAVSTAFPPFRFTQRRSSECLIYDDASN